MTGLPLSSSFPVDNKIGLLLAGVPGNNLICAVLHHVALLIHEHIYNTAQAGLKLGSVHGTTFTSQSNYIY